MDSLPNEIINIILENTIYKYDKIYHKSGYKCFNPQILFVCKKWYKIIKKWKLKFKIGFYRYGNTDIYDYYIEINNKVLIPSLSHYLKNYKKNINIIAWYSKKYSDYFSYRVANDLISASKFPEYMRFPEIYIAHRNIIQKIMMISDEEDNATWEDLWELTINGEYEPLLIELLQYNDSDAIRMLKYAYENKKMTSHKCLVNYIENLIKSQTNVIQNI